MHSYGSDYENGHSYYGEIPGFLEAKKEAQKLLAGLNAEVNSGEQRWCIVKTYFCDKGTGSAKFNLFIFFLQNCGGEPCNTKGLSQERGGRFQCKKSSNNIMVC